MTKTHRGFTLVELLIVIVVIGILAAMMMLSSNEAVSSAKATAIVSNLRNLKTAALAYYDDNMDYYDNPANISNYMEGNKLKTDKFNELCEYLNGKDMPDKNDYWIAIRQSASDAKSTENDAGWWVVYNASALTGPDGERIRKKIAGRASSLGLVRATNEYNIIYTGTAGDASNAQNNIALQVR